MEPFKISFEDFGMGCDHNMPCAVTQTNPAVLNTNKGVFEPSWVAQKQGWRLIQLRTRWQRLAYRLLFKSDRF